VLIGAEDLERIDAADAAVVADPLAFVRTSVAIAVAGVVCSVHFDRDDAAACFAARYADLIVNGAAPERHAFAMRDPAIGWLFWSAAPHAFRWPHGDLAAHVVAFLADAVALTAFVQQRADGIVSLHAASVGLPGGIAIIVGDSNAGKTTTAIACARAELDLYSDERCLIDRHAFVHRFPRAINVRAPGLRLLLRDPLPGNDPIGARLRAHGETDWNDVRISDLMPARSACEPRPLRAVFVLAGYAGAAAVETVPAVRAVHAAARWTHGAGGGLDKIGRLLDVFAAVPCYALQLGAPAQSARLIRSVLQRHVAELEPA
jgi:hypothetical protein